MAVRPLRLFPDPILSRPCAQVTGGDHTINELITDLKDTLAASPGVGLAAPQIGVAKQVSIVDLRHLKKKPLPANHGFVLLLNPELIRGDGEQLPREGCLSVPDLLANVKRFARVIVRTHTLENHPYLIEAEGFEALAFQHELDHLQGRLFLDRVANVKTDIFRRKSY
jgi:peptide deformylase